MRPTAVGLLIDWLEDDYQNELLAGVREAAEDLNTTLIAFVGGTLDARDRFRFGKHRNFVYDLPSSECIDGLLVSGGTLCNVVGPQRLAEFCARYRPMPMCSMSVAMPGIPSVIVDPIAGMRDALECLVSTRGFRRVACVRGPPENSEADARYAVYCSVLDEHGIALDPDLVAMGDFTRPSGRPAVDRLFERDLGVEAVVFANDSMALAGLQRLQERGVRVPEDVAIVGFDDIPEARFASVPLSTVRQPIRRMGRCALDLLVRQLRGERVAEVTQFRSEFVRRRSCGSSHRVGVPDRIVAGATIRDTLQGSRPALMAKLAEMTSEAEAVVQAFATGVTQVLPEAFADALRRVVGVALTRGEDTAVWQAIVSTLRAETEAYAAVHPELGTFTAEMWNDVRVAIGEIGERIQARSVLDLHRQLAVTRRMGEGMMTSLNVESIMRLVAEQLTALEIPSCHVALFDGDRAGATATLVLASRSQGDEPRLEPRRFQASELVPGADVFARERRTMILQPLYYEEEQFGFALCEMGPRHGVVYEAVRDHISTAIKRARLVRQLVEQTALRQRAEEARLRDEVAIAARIQTSVLPHSFDVAGLEISAEMLPASHVGGDYYDIVPCAGGCWIGIGDVAGHGLATGLIMLMIQSMVAGMVELDATVEPSSILRAVNGALYANVRERLLQDEHATLAVIRYDRRGHLTLAGGHEDLVIYRAATQTVELVPTPGPWVGALRTLPTNENADVDLCDQDVLVLYTDGVVEALNSERRRFGLERLMQLVAEAGREPADVIRARVMAAVLEWSPIPSDDVTVLIARYHAPTTADLPAPSAPSAGP